MLLDFIATEDTFVAKTSYWSVPIPCNVRALRIDIKNLKTEI